MKIVRRISGYIDTLSKKSEIEKVMNSVVEWGAFTADFEEESLTYLQIKNLVAFWGWEDSVIGTLFSKKEVYSAEVLCFIGAKTFAYPEPQSFTYLENTFAESCKMCGTFGDQISTFQVKKQYSLGSQPLGSLHWVFDQLFTTENMYDFFFKNLGVKSRSVRIFNKEQYLKDIVQLDIPQHKDTLDMINLEYSLCDVCGRIKYSPTIHGFIPLPKEKSFEIMKTKEFFGTGYSATHRILVSNAVMQSIIKLKLARYHQFIPCE